MNSKRPTQNLLEELMAIRRSLATDKVNEANLPLLDDVVSTPEKTEVSPPLLSDKVLEPLPEHLLLARKSWQDVKGRMLDWIQTLQEPHRTLVKQWFEGMQRPMENAWETLFTELNEEQRQQWQNIYHQPHQE